MFEDVVHPLFLSLTYHPIPGRLYCPVCISQTKPPTPTGWGNRADVASHLRSFHGWEESTNADALSTQELVAALMRWRKGQEQLGDEFADGLRLVRNLYDFLAECET